MIKIEIFKLFGSIMIEDEKAMKSLDKTDKKAESVGTKFKNMIGTAAKWGAAIGAGAAVVGGAMLGVATKTAETTDRIDKLSQKIGMSRKGFQEWEFILSQNGATIEGLQTGLKSMALSVDQAAEGTGKGAEAFKQLGISVTDASGNLKSQEQIFNESVTALQGMEDGTQKAILANQLFGRSGTELMPLLNGASGSVEELRQKAQDLGLVIGDEAIDAGVKFTDSMDQVKRMLGAVGTQVGAALMPIMQGFLEWVISKMPTIQKIFKTAFDFINVVVSTAYQIFKDNILPILITLFNWVQSNMPTFRRIFDTVFNAVWNIVKRVWDIVQNGLLPILKTLYNWVSPYFPSIESIVVNAFNTIIGIANSVIDVFGGIVNTVRNVLDWFDKFNNKKIDNKDVSVNTGYTPRYAKGTNYHPGGMAIVGEQGPELVNLPRGSQVYTAQETSEMVNGNQEITINTPVYLDGKKITTSTSKIQFQKNRGKYRALGVVPE